MLESTFPKLLLINQVSLASENGDIGQQWQMRDDGVMESKVKCHPHPHQRIIRPLGLSILNYHHDDHHYQQKQQQMSKQIPKHIIRRHHWLNTNCCCYLISQLKMGLVLDVIWADVPLVSDNVAVSYIALVVTALMILVAVLALLHEGKFE